MTEFIKNDTPQTTKYFIGSWIDNLVDLKVIVLLKIKLLEVPNIKDILLLDDGLNPEYVDSRVYAIKSIPVDIKPTTKYVINCL